MFYFHFFYLFTTTVAKTSSAQVTMSLSLSIISGGQSEIIDESEDRGFGWIWSRDGVGI